ncbi:MAG: hypothetical protein HFI90_11365 [Clostridia bacterium]|nr:hypothetical protein [Clostridia bacterium]
MEGNWKQTFYKDILRFGTLFACFLLAMGPVALHLPLLSEGHALLGFFPQLAWFTFLECLAASGIFYYEWNWKPEQENQKNREKK